MQLDEQVADLMGAAMNDLALVLMDDYVVQLCSEHRPCRAGLLLTVTARADGSIPTLVSLAAIGLFLYAICDGVG